MFLGMVQRSANLNRILWTLFADFIGALRSVVNIYLLFVKRAF